MQRRRLHAAQEAACSAGVCMQRRRLHATQETACNAGGCSIAFSGGSSSGTINLLLAAPLLTPHYSPLPQGCTAVGRSLLLSSLGYARVPRVLT